MSRTRSASTAARGEVVFSPPESGTLVAHLSGSWSLRGERPAVAAAEREIRQEGVRRLSFDTGGVDEWDSAILTYLVQVLDVCRSQHVEAERQGLPDGVQRLLELAAAVPEKEGARATAVRQPILERIGMAALDAFEEGRGFLAFIGKASRAVGRLFTFRARFRVSDLLQLIQECGAAALPIVTLISFLFGLILAFMGAVQLRQFGAAIYVADLVGLAMAREMGAVMTGIIMSGRTGAAFAAQLGTMKVTEEIDALTTMGIEPMEFLVLPRMIALFLMMPLLCVYADLVGMLGGAVVGIGMLDLSPLEYFRQTVDAIALKDFVLGVVKSGVFGVEIAVAGCLRGMQSGNSASAVGDAATSAVVTSIVLLIVTDGVFAVACNILGGVTVAEASPSAPKRETHIAIKDLTMAYGTFVVMRDLNFTVGRSDIFIIMGGSGCGKSTLLRHMVGLVEPQRGEVLYGGQSFTRAEPEERRHMLQHVGVLYQKGALSRSMTLAENLGIPLGEYTDLSPAEIREVASLKLALVGLKGFEDYYPNQISGGMQKRAGLARAMALDPQVLFFDEPSAGLDPISSRLLDELILQLRDSLGATVVVVTHELASIFTIGDNSVFLDAESRTMIATGHPQELLAHNEDPRVRRFLTRGTAGRGETCMNPSRGRDDQGRQQ